MFNAIDSVHDNDAKLALRHLAKRIDGALVRKDQTIVLRAVHVIVQKRRMQQRYQAIVL